MFIIVTFLFLWPLHSSRVAAVPAYDEPSSRIISGVDATIIGNPFTTAINVQTSNSRYFCAGTLIGHQWIVTAGQCVNGATLFTINLGSEYLEAEDSNRVTVATSTYYLHPEYNAATLENDIGLIKLRMPLTYTDYIKPVDYFANVTQGRSNYVLGWGHTSDDESSLSSRLKLAFLQPLSNEDCKMTYGDQIKDNMVCMAGFYNQGICHGDTGGPLIEKYRTEADGLVGIASFMSGNGCGTPEPSGFTRTYSYVDWIRSTTELDIIVE